MKDRRYDIASGTGFHRHTPEFLPVSSAVAFHVGGGDVDDLLHSGELTEHEARVRSVVIAIFPNRLAGRFLQAHEAGPFVSTRRGVDVFSIGDGRTIVAVATGSGATATRGVAAKPFGPKIFGVLLAPNQFTGLQGNTGEHARGALAKQQISINHRRCTRPRTIDIGVLPGFRVGCLPKSLTGGSIDDGGGFHGFTVYYGFMAHHEATLGKNQAALPFTHGHLPNLLRFGR